MLAEDDRVLAERDPALPVLRRLLDDEAALDMFRATMSEASLTAVRLTYLRYKPETSVLAAFEAQSASGPRQFHVTAYRIDEFAKLEKLAARPSAARPIVAREHGVAIWHFPLDGEIDSLAAAATEDARRRMLARIAPQWEPDGYAEWSLLRYKPQRRFVARVVGDDGRPAVLRLYAPSEFAQARRAAKSAPPAAVGIVPQVIGRSDRHAAILMEWVAGTSLAELMQRGGAIAAIDAAHGWRTAGKAVARFHNIGSMKLPRRDLGQELKELRQSAADLVRLCPELATDSAAIVDQCAAAFAHESSRPTVIHGDLHLGQLVVEGDGALLIDIDAAAVGDAAFDLGSLRTSLEAHAAASRAGTDLPVDGDAMWDQFLRGYGASVPMPDARMVAAATAAAWLRRAQEPFRHRQPQWRAAAVAALGRAHGALTSAAQVRGRAASTRPLKSQGALSHVRATIDAAEAIADLELALRNDPPLAHAAAALDPACAAYDVGPLVRMHFGDESLRPVATRVLRHKPGRRCVIEYQFAGAGPGPVRSVLGKIHAKSRHRECCLRQRALVAAGFGSESPDGILVPAPVGVVDKHRMWLQERVPGVDGWTAIAGPQGPQVAARIVDAVVKLQAAPLELARTHTLDDEIDLLADRLAQASARRPDLRERIERLMQECRRRVLDLAQLPLIPAHRDFYPDQIRVDGDHLFVLDHDLLCLADPRLDIANFLGHLDEMDIRRTCEFGNVRWAAKLAGEGPLVAARDAIAGSLRQNMSHVHSDDFEFLAVVTLARHIFISGQIAGRGQATEAIVSRCERKLELSKQSAKPYIGQGRRSLPDSPVVNQFKSPIHRTD